MRRFLGLALALLALGAAPALAQQPTGYLDAPTGAPVYVTPSAPLPQLSDTFSSTGSTTLSAGTTTSNVALPGKGQYVEVANGGTVTAYVALGVGSGTTATTAGYAIPAGWTVFLQTNQISAGTATYLAGITATSTATLTITSGTLAPLTGSGGSSNVTITGPLGPGTAASSVRTLAQIDQTTPGTTNGIQVNAALPAGANLIGKVGIDQTTPGSTNGVNLAPTSATGAAITPVVSSAVESNHVLKASAGNLYGVTVTVGATSGLLMVFNATSAPVDGAVTPTYCIVVPANTSAGISFSGIPPAAFSTGITAVFSTGTVCTTKAASTTAFFTGLVQ